MVQGVQFQKQIAALIFKLICEVGYVSLHVYTCFT